MLGGMAPVQATRPGSFSPFGESTISRAGRELLRSSSDLPRRLRNAGADFN